MILVLTLATALLSPASHASAKTTALALTSERLVQGAGEDVTFLSQHVADCTRFASTIQQQLVAPIARDLQSFQQRLARYTDEGARACTSRADLDYISAEISAKLALANTPQSQLMGMTGDQAMTKALSGGDDGYPNCQAEDARDVRTTRQLKAYFGLKLKLIALRAAVNTLKNDTDCEKQE